MMRRFLIPAILLPSFGFAVDPLSFPSAPPTEPGEAASKFHVLDGFEMQLIAAEPLVTDPVAITYDAEGRAYVCEMNDYPYTDKEHHKHSQENPTDQPIGRVRFLTDTDGDGVFDKSTVFADGLSWPTGSACWKGGIFVTATPDIWYLKDTNDDGVADLRVKVFTGFKKLNVQAVMNNPIWGMDHRIYVAGGSNGGEIRRVEGSESVMPLLKAFKPIPVKRSDFSFDPITGDVRLESGGARFGNAFDDWGNRFLCNIRNPCQHILLQQRMLARNPFLTISSPLIDCAEAGDQLPVFRTSPTEPWREFRAKRWVQEGSTLPRSELVGAGVVTSSSGITVYRGDAYPPEYRQFAFVADVAGNLFYRMKLVADGASFKAVQMDGSKNFCTGDDLWFRPVNFVNAPDGCLHVCDMYREVIEHPWSIPDDIHAALDLLRGRDRGRIWRLAPKNFDVRRRAPVSLSKATTGELVTLLDHPNAWHRETAQRLLYERQDKASVAPLRAMAKRGSTPQGRVNALWAMEGIGFFGPGPSIDFKAPDRLTSEKDAETRQRWQQDAGVTQTGYGLILEALHDPDANVRRQAIRLRPEALFAPRELSELYRLREDAEKVLSDPDITVQIEAIWNHASVWSPAAFPKFGQLCLQSDHQPQILQAALISCAESSFTMFQEVLRSPKVSESPALQQFLCDCAGMIGRAFPDGDPDAPYHVVHHLVLRGPADVFARRVLHSICAELRRTGASLDVAATRSFHESRDADSLAWIDELKQSIVKDLRDPSASQERQLPALGLVPDFVPPSQALPLLAQFLAASQPVEIQAAALDALSSFRSEPSVTPLFLDSWSSFSPPLREKVMTLLLSRTDRIAKLLDAVEAGRIKPGQMSAAARATLARQKNPILAARIAKLFDLANSNRTDVIQGYSQAMQSADLTHQGDAKRGLKVYEAACMVCHRHKDQGNDIGPNLATIQSWTPDQILVNVLDPNREVSPNFALYVIEANDGRTITGIIASESAGNLVIKLADGTQQTLLRNEIQSIASPGVSLMPEGLEAVITPQQMADLIEFLREP